jgi:hypothetical protein
LRDSERRLGESEEDRQLILAENENLTKEIEELRSTLQDLDGQSRLMKTELDESQVALSELDRLRREQEMRKGDVRRKSTSHSPMFHSLTHCSLFDVSAAGRRPISHYV